MPARKKDPSTRGRKNKATTAATLIHSVEDGGLAATYDLMTVAQLRAELGARKLATRGRKPELIARLVAADDPAPTLPDRPAEFDKDGNAIASKWHPETLSWWADMWASPMATEYHSSDKHALFVLAVLVDQFWRSPDSKLAAEIRLQRVAFGLTPYDRRRLEWTIETAEDAKESGKRRGERQGTPQPKPKEDPRLKLVQ